jgi:hypothetical protein
LFRIKTAITFAYGLKEKCVIYEKLSTQKVTFDFNSHRPFAQTLASQNSKEKYESGKILDFVKKKENLIFYNFVFILWFFQFLIILNVSHYFGLFEFFLFFEIFQVSN